MAFDFGIYNYQATISYNNPYQFGFSFDYYVYNDGSGSATGVDLAFLWGDSLFSPPQNVDNPLNFISYDFAPGQVYNNDYDTGVNFAQAGTYYVGLQIDYYNEYAEWDELDNVINFYKVEVIDSNSALLYELSYGWHSGWHLDWYYGWTVGWNYGWYNGWGYGWIQGFYNNGSGWVFGWYQGWAVGWFVGWDYGWYQGWAYGWTDGGYVGWGWYLTDSVNVI